MAVERENVRVILSPQSMEKQEQIKTNKKDNTK